MTIRVAAVRALVPPLRSLIGLMAAAQTLHEEPGLSPWLGPMEAGHPTARAIAAWIAAFSFAHTPE